MVKKITHKLTDKSKGDELHYLLYLLIVKLTS